MMHRQVEESNFSQRSGVFGLALTFVYSKQGPEFSETLIANHFHDPIQIELSNSSKEAHE